MQDIKNNVLDFMEKCAKEVGEKAKGEFYDSMYCDCIEQGMQSPIEHILYVAFNTIARLNDYEPSDPVDIGDEHYIVGIDLWCQHRIGKYRVDFLAFYGKYPRRGEKGYFQHSKKLVVECDSQSFHERTEQERRYEKARDRYLQTKGYTVFHYTGTEIFKEPMRIAKEIIAYLTDSNIEELQESYN